MATVLETLKEETVRSRIIAYHDLSHSPNPQHSL